MLKLISAGSACALLLLLGSAARADDGGASTGGGGIIVFQAKALTALLSSAELHQKFKTRSMIKTIQHVSFGEGGTLYRLTTSENCTLDARTIPFDSGMQYHISLGVMICPEEESLR